MLTADVSSTLHRASFAAIGYLAAGPAAPAGLGHRVIRQTTDESRTHQAVDYVA